MRILMVGGHGMLGAPVTRALAAGGHQVVLLARDPVAVAEKLPGFETVSGDVEHPDTLDAALAGCDAVHINLAGGPNPEDYDRVEHIGVVNVAAAAVRHGIGRISYLTGTSVCEENADFYATEAKWKGEQAVRASGVPYTIFRASWFMESLPLFASGEAVTIIGKHRYPLHWVAVNDYAQMVLRALALPEAANRTFYIYGPEAITMNDAIARYHDAACPDLPLVAMSPADMEHYARDAGDPKLADFAKLMAYYERFEENNDPGPANVLLGKPQTRLVDWLAAHRAGRIAN